jgi:hypothetical protein
MGTKKSKVRKMEISYWAISFQPCFDSGNIEQPRENQTLNSKQQWQKKFWKPKPSDQNLQKT